MFKKLNPIYFIRFIIESDLFFPLALILVYAVFWYFATGIIPTPAEILNSFGKFYQKYGYEIITASSLTESLIGVGIFAPGGAALALGVIFARTGETNLILVIVFAVLGAMIGYTIDYFLGYYGFSNFLSKSRLGKHIGFEKSRSSKISRKAMFLAYFYGNIGAFMSLTLGSLKYPFRKFFLVALISTIFWASFWSLLIFALGDIVITVLSRYIFIVIILAIGISTFMKFRTKVRKESKES